MKHALGARPVRQACRAKRMAVTDEGSCTAAARVMASNGKRRMLPQYSPRLRTHNSYLGSVRHW